MLSNSKISFYVSLLVNNRVIEIPTFLMLEYLTTKKIHIYIYIYIYNGLCYR
jgi:hypothetical protein